METQSLHLLLFNQMLRHLGFGEGIFLEIILLLLLSLFSAAEAAILAVNRFKARHDAENGVKGAQAVLSLHAQKEDFLPSILALQTLLTVAISTIGTALTGFIHPGTEGLFVSALIITVYILVFGEIVPKTVATHTPNNFAYKIGPFILILTRFVSRILQPLTWSLRQILNLLGYNPSHAFLTEKDLKYLISLSREHGILNKEEEKLLKNIFELADSKVEEVMVPRTQIESIEENASVEEVKKKFTKTRFSRYPVYSKNLDNIVGFLDVRDLIAAEVKGENIRDLKTFIRPVVFVPESKRVGHLLQEMRRDNFQVAIVVDEYGGTAGFVSVTDLLEEIVGKLPVENPSLYEEIHSLDEKTLLVSSSTKLEELEEKLGVHFENKEVQTIGGLVLKLFGRIPEKGEQIHYKNLRLIVAEKTGYKISKVMVAKESP